MFSRLLIVRLRAAEKALKGGRLDEAHRLVTAPDIRADRRGQALMANLTDKLVERARAHFADERFTEALHDLTKAESTGLRTDDIAELRGHIRVVSDEVARQAHSRRRRLNDARQRVEQGSLAAGREILGSAGGDDPDAKRLAADIDNRAERAADAFGQVEKMLKQKQLSAAVERFKKAVDLDPHAPQAIALESDICDRVVSAARAAFDGGRINRALDEMGTLERIGRSLPARRDMEELLDLAWRASRLLDEGDFEETRRAMLRLQRLAPKVSWINKSADQLAKLDGLMTMLHGGPLGEHAKSKVGKSRPAPIRPTTDLKATVMLGDRSAPDNDLPDRLLLLVDGGGSYLLLRKDRLTIGRAMTRNLPDIPIQSDLAERHAEISRVEDDYFLFSSKVVEVDGRQTRHQLLRPDNRITLSNNARFTFRMPHPQSPSAIMELGGSTKMPEAIRRVILFRQTAMIGYGKNTHITCNGADQNLVLFERAGRLWVRRQRNGRVDTEATPITIGEQIEMANVSFVVQPFKPAALGRTI